MKTKRNRALSLILALAMALSLCALAPAASAAAPRLEYELSVVGAEDPHDIYIQAGETFEVTFTIHFLDSTPSYDLRWLQNELLYDGGFFYTTRTYDKASTIIDVSFVQYLGLPMIKLSSMNVALTGPDTAVARFSLRARTGLADGTTTTLRSGSRMCSDVNNERCAISAQDLTVTIGTRPLPTSSVVYHLAGGTMAPTAFPETDAQYVDYEDETPYYAQSVLTGATITLPAAPAKENSSFLGWSDGTATYAAGASYTVSADAAFTAQWQPWPTVTLNAAGGTINGANSAVVAPNTAFALPTATRDGYSFLGWSDGKDVKTELYLVGTSDVSLTAQWARRYTLTLDAAEGTIDGSASFTALAGDSVSLPSARRTGYQFSGWSYGGSAVGASFTMPAADATLTARWTENPSVLLDADGGTVEAATAYSGEPGSSVALPTPVRTGYVFGGWSDGSRTYAGSYTLGSASVTLKAVWTECAHALADYEVTGTTEWTHVEGGHTHTRSVTSAATCPTCGKELVKTADETADCSYSDGWSITAAGHSHICTVCGDEADSAKHSYDGKGVCTVCGFKNPELVMPASVSATARKLEVSVSGTTATVGSIDEVLLDQLVSGSEVMIDAASFGRIDSVTLPAGLAGQAAGVGGMTVTMTTGTLSFDAAALRAVNAANSGALTLTLRSAALDTAQKEGTKDLDVRSAFSVKATADGRELTDLGGGKVSVDVVFSPASGTSGKDYVVYGVAADGRTERLTTDYVNGALRFALGRFGDCVAVYEKSGAFRDVPASAWYADAVAWAVEQGITTGTGDGLFSPDASCTRAQAVTFLWRAAGKPGASTGAAFSDVPSGAWYADAVRWAVEQGVTTGTGNGLFSPDAVCDRAQIVTFLMRSRKASAEAADTFADVPSNAWYAGAVAWAVEQGITTGTGNGLFSPNLVCSRAQIVTFLYRCFAK